MDIVKRKQYLKAVATEYCKLYMNGKIEVVSGLLKYECLAGRYTGAESGIIGELLNLYVNLNENKISRPDAMVKQREILAEVDKLAQNEAA